MARDDSYSEVQWGALRPILQDLTDRLTRIEQFLAASGLQVPASPQSASVPSAFGAVSDAVPGTFDPTPVDSPGRVAAAVHGVDVGVAPVQLTNPAIPDFIVQLALSGRKIQAVKEYRSFTGLPLKEAKAIIDQVAAGGY
jgi:hypothetical protein